MNAGSPISDELIDKLKSHLALVYGEERCDDILNRLIARLQNFRDQHPMLSRADASDRFSQKDALVIAYGDHVRDAEQQRDPLEVLREILKETLGGVLGGVHVLPFFPWSSDDGFSIKDYFKVDPEVGDWRDIEELAAGYRLMVDAVVNHISAESDWFRNFCGGGKEFENFFIEMDPNTDLSSVTRPRTCPLLTPVETVDGTKHVWTTFSADQVDLNVKTPECLLRIVDVLLHYISHGARLIRLDAIGYLWKEIGTSCIHLPQTHELVKFFRTVMDAVAPNVMLVTETNVPHPDNIAYFGDGTDEAQMVYNFSLPPLILHAFLRQDATVLSDWAANLEDPGPEATFFNFTASHDGIGVMPAKGILDDAEINFLAEKVKEHGGLLGLKSDSDGTESVYELNCTYFEALNGPDCHSDLMARRFICSQAMMMAFAGIPGIYFSSLFGGRNWHEGVKETGRNRTINRRKWEVGELREMFANRASVHARILYAYRRLLSVRRANDAFHPNAPQAILQLHNTVFAILRHSLSKPQCGVLALHNTAEKPVTITVNPSQLHSGNQSDEDFKLRDMVDNSVWYSENGVVEILLEDCGWRWLAFE